MSIAYKRFTRSDIFFLTFALYISDLNTTLPSFRPFPSFLVTELRFHARINFQGLNLRSSRCIIVSKNEVAA